MAGPCSEEGFITPRPDKGAKPAQDGLVHPSAPFIHRFKTARQKYVYDINTRRILRVSDVVWDVLPDVGPLDDPQIIAKHAPAHGEQPVAEALEQIAQARQRDNLFLSCRPQEVTPVSRERVEAGLRQHREQLILNVTESCNFRCRYCVFGGGYEHHRSHSARSMSWDIARPALDEFLSHCELAEDRVISFYGGEPLLNLALIRRAVVYAREERGDRTVRFGITTNGLLLSGEAAELIAREDFMVSVSLDGPEAVHDRNRRTVAGEPTWARVMANVRAFLEAHPEYRTNGRFRFSAVATPETDLREVESFFGGCDLFTDTMSAEVSEQKPSPDLPAIQPTDPLAVSGLALRDALLADLTGGQFGALRTHPSRWVRVSTFERPFVSFHKRGFDTAPLPEKLALLNTCIPGARRIFVNVAGEYFACERVVEAAEGNIGNVRDGVNPSKVWAMLERWTLASGDDCRHCWCLPTCKAGCWASVGKDGTVTPQAKREACHICRLHSHQVLVDYCTILEQNPKALDYTESIILS